jgi:hypothetical protein
LPSAPAKPGTFAWSWAAVFISVKLVSGVELRFDNPRRSRLLKLKLPRLMTVPPPTEVARVTSNRLRSAITPSTKSKTALSSTVSMSSLTVTILSPF